MIELANDKLCFSFPHVAQELRALTEQYTQDMLPGILDENREAAFSLAAMEDYRVSAMKENERNSMRQFLRELPPEKIAEEFRKKVNTQKAKGELKIEFERTLRIPDDGKSYCLPAGLGAFPLRHVDDFAERIPASWLKRGGVVMPMYQAEALWLNFQSGYPFALKVASGKINAVSGQTWQRGLSQSPQDYLHVPMQPWLDGFAVGKGRIRQFVAMPLGQGYSVEEQLTGSEEYGGIQLEAFPMKPAFYYDSEILPNLPSSLADLIPDLLPQPKFEYHVNCLMMCGETSSMGLGVGGRMKQEIYQDRHPLVVWDLQASSRCFVHLCDALSWREITGTNPPQPPVTAKEYAKHKLPWFDFYREDVAVLEGSKTLSQVKSVLEVSQTKRKQPLGENESIETGEPIHSGPSIRPREAGNQILDGNWE